MEIQQYHLSFEELNIQQHSIFDLMGYSNQEIPEQIVDTYNQEIAKFQNLNDISGGYKIYPCQTVDPENNTIRIENEIFEVGKQVNRLMKNSDQIAVFACTAGKTISQRSKELMEKGDVLEGYIVDVIGSVVVEKAMDLIHFKLKNLFHKHGMNLSNRYSPGYCDWNVAEQHKLFSLLPKDFCGISLSKSALMYPIKSVSGFIGIGKQVKFNEYTCNICTQQKCIYRNLNKERIAL